MRQHMRLREAALRKGSARHRADPRTDGRRAVAPRGDAISEDAVHARILTRICRTGELTCDAFSRDDWTMPRNARKAPETKEKAVAPSLLAWYGKHARVLPW